MMSADFLDLLRCPATGQSLAWADEKLVAQVNERLRVAANAAPTTRLIAALVRADRQMLYPIQNGIPVLLTEAGIPV